MSTVRELVAEVQQEMLAGDVQPDRAAELLMRATSLLGHVLENIRNTDAAYAQVLLSHLESEEKANRAKIRAETSAEYRQKQEARDTARLLDEMTKSFKIVLRWKTEEHKGGY